MRILGSIVAPSAALMASCDSKFTGCRALSRSWVLLVNRAWRSLPACLYFNALGPSWPSQIGSKIAILGECDNAAARDCLAHGCCESLARPRSSGMALGAYSERRAPRHQNRGEIEENGSPARLAGLHLDLALRVHSVPRTETGRRRSDRRSRATTVPLHPAGIPHSVARTLDEALAALDAWGCLRIKIGGVA